MTRGVHKVGNEPRGRIIERVDPFFSLASDEQKMSYVLGSWFGRPLVICVYTYLYTLLIYDEYNNHIIAEFITHYMNNSILLVTLSSYSSHLIQSVIV